MRDDVRASRLDPNVRLSSRRIEIVRLLRNGFVEKEIARRLGIRRDSVAKHVAATMRILAATRAPQLVAEAIRHGSID